MNTNEQISPIIERMFLFLEDGEWDKADEYSERVLDVEPKNAYAYLGKLMIEYRVKQKTDFAQCKKDFSQSANYKRIAQFGEPSLVTEINGYLNKIKEANQEKIIHRTETIAKTKTSIKHNLPVIIISAIIVAVIIIILVINLAPKSNDNPTTSKSNTIEYKNMTINLPDSDDYTARVSNGKIYLSGKIDFTINDFLGCVRAPSGKSFYATGWAAANGNASFTIKNYATVSTQYYSNGDQQTETVNLVFYGYGGYYKSRYVSQDGSRAPLYYYSASQISPRFPNDGTNTYKFKSGETTIIGQYQSPRTTVSIVVVKE